MKLIIISILLILLVSLVFAAEEQTIRLPKTPPLVEQTVPQGENATLSLTEFTRALLKLYEGTRVDFNIYNPDTRVLEVVNSLIINEVKSDSVDFLLSIDGSEYEDTNMKLGETLQLSYSSSIVPFMFLEVRKLRYMEDENGDLIKHATMFFNVPLITRSVLDNTGNTAKDIDVEKVIPVTNENKNKNLKYYLLGVVGLIVAGVLLFKKPDEQKNPKTESEKI